jgi:uncharacterized protein YjbK
MLKKLSGIVSGQSFIQVNYYYDTEKFTCSKNSETIRVRSKEDKLTFERKFGKRIINNTKISSEVIKPIKALPKSIILNNYELNLIGNMVTHRTNFHFEKCIVSLDKNYYLGLIDYEIEVEVEDENTVLPSVIQVFAEEPSSGKSSRFIATLISITDIYEV